MKHKFKKIEVHWVDSHGSGGWRYIPDIKTPQLDCYSMGFLIKEDKDSITMSASYSANDSSFDMLTIPKCAIVKRRFFK